MIDPSLTISIDRTALSLSPLVLVAENATDLGLTDYAEPALLPRVSYAPTSDFQHGDVPLGWGWQQTLLNFSFLTIADTEAESRALVDAVRNAITQGLEYEVTVTASDAAAEVWTCNPGSLTPAGARTLVNMRHVRPVWSVSLPCYPVRSFA